MQQIKISTFLQLVIPPGNNSTPTFQPTNDWQPTLEHNALDDDNRTMVLLPYLLLLARPKTILTWMIVSFTKMRYRTMKPTMTILYLEKYR